MVQVLLIDWPKVGWVLVGGWVVGPQYFCVIPWHFENGVSSRLMMFLLKMVDYSMSFLSLSTWIFFRQTSWEDHSAPFLLSELFCGSPPSSFDDVLAEDGGLLYVLPLAVHPKFFWRTSRVDNSGPFLFSELFCGTHPSCFDDVLTEDGELLHVLPLAVHLEFFLAGE